MFDNCNSLQELNARRRELLLSGTPAASVNAAYNRAKQALVSAAPSYRKIPTFRLSDPVPIPRTVLPMSMQIKKVPDNVLIIKDGVAYI